MLKKITAWIKKNPAKASILGAAAGIVADLVGYQISPKVSLVWSILLGGAP